MFYIFVRNIIKYQFEGKCYIICLRNENIHEPPKIQRILTKIDSNVF